MLVGDQPSLQVLDANAPRQLYQEEQGWVLMQHFSPLGGFIEGERPAPHQLHSLLAAELQWQFFCGLRQEWFWWYVGHTLLVTLHVAWRKSSMCPKPGHAAHPSSGTHCLPWLATTSCLPGDRTSLPD